MSRRIRELGALTLLLALIWAGCASDADSSGEPWAEDEQPRNGQTSCGGAVHQASGDEREYHCSGWSGEWACACDTYRPEIPDPVSDGTDSEAQSCQQALEDVCNVNGDAFGACADQDGLGRCDPIMTEHDTVSESAWSCACAGDAASTVVEASSCDQALIDHCATTCSEGSHMCQPTEEPGTYHCDCDGETMASDAYGPSCDAALARACTTELSCESDGDVCVPTNGRDMWECSCTSYYHASRTIYADSCEEARERACSPIGAPCNGWNGFCDDGVDENEDYGFFCTCNDGSEGFRTPEELGGTDECNLALEDVCGAGAPPENFQCTKDSVDYQLICTKGEQDGVDGYNCGCDYSCENAAGGSGTFIETDSCQDAIGQMSCSGC